MPDPANSDTIFNKPDDNSGSTTEGITNTGNQVTEPTIPDSLKELVGEGKKYKDLDTALNSLPHALGHIDTLEAENSDLRKKATEGKVVEDILETISNQSNNDASQTGEVDESKIVDNVIKSITDKAVEGQKNINKQQANDSLISLAGDKKSAVELLKQKAASMGVDTDDLMKIAEKSPEGFLQLFVQANQGNSNSQSRPSEGTISSDSLLLNKGPEEGTYQWWQEQKKARGIGWYSGAEASAQRIKDADKLGRDKFFNSK